MLLCAAALAMGGLAGCNKKQEPTPETPTDTTVHVESVSLDKAELKLTPGATAALNATVLPENAANKAVTFSSSSTAAATVDANGVVTAVAVGDSVITATSTDGNKTATCNVTVKNVFTGLSLEDTSVPFNRAAQTIALTGALPDGATFTYVDGFASAMLPGTHVIKGVVKGEGYYDLELAANLTITSEKEYTPFVVNNFETYANENDLADDVTFEYYDYQNDEWIEPGGKGSMHLADNNDMIGVGSKTLRMQLTYQNSAFKAEKELGQTFNKTFEAIELDTLVDSRTGAGNTIIEVQLLFKDVPLPTAYAEYKDAIYLDYRLTDDAPSNWTHWVMPLNDPSVKICGGTFTLEQMAGLGLSPEILTLYLDKVAIVAKPMNGNYQNVDVYFDNIQLRHAGEKSSRQFVHELDGNVYTIESTDGTIYKITFDGDSSRMESLNLKTNIALVGEISQENEKVTFVGSPDGGTHKVTYTLRALSEDKKIAIDPEVTGDTEILESVAAHLNFEGKVGGRVYLVDDFGSYENTGTGYDRGHKDLEALSGLRGAYYGEVYNENKPAPGLIGDQNWNLMNDSGWTDYIALATDAGHSGNAMKIVGKNSWPTRYINFQMLNPNGAPFIGRGAYLSFFVKGSAAYTMTVRAYYVNKLDAATAAATSGNVAIDDVKVTTSWTRVTINLSQYRDVYGFMFSPAKTADVGLYIDDIMIHGEASPYAVYTPPTINGGNYAYSDGTDTYVLGVNAAVNGAALVKNGSPVMNMTVEMADGVATFKDATNSGADLTLEGKISKDDFTITSVAGTAQETYAALAQKKFSKLAGLNYDFANETSEHGMNDKDWSWRKYDGGRWQLVTSTQMNVKRGNEIDGVRNYFGNMVCGYSIPWAYRYQQAHKLGAANHFSVNLANDFSNADDISAKVRLILMDGSMKYIVGTAEEFVTIPKNTGDRMNNGWYGVEKNFDACDVNYIEFVIKSAKSESCYLYFDNLVLNYVQA